MNFLAHAYLSGNDPEILAGNFMGDFIKGRIPEELPEGIQNGILLHREIDFYTDHHAIVQESKEILRNEFRHYSAVVVDMFYDHLLAANWDTYGSVALQEFTQTLYATIEQYKKWWPDPFARMFRYMSTHDWLLQYQSVEGIGQALSGMARRTKFDSGMEKATEYLKSHYEIFDSHFRLFFPILLAHITDFRNQLTDSSRDNS